VRSALLASQLVIFGLATISYLHIHLPRITNVKITHVCLSLAITITPAVAKPLKPVDAVGACKDMQASSDLADGAMAVQKEYCIDKQQMSYERCRVVSDAVEYANRMALAEIEKCKKAVAKAAQ
jgi:hypothetical protein